MILLIRISIIYSRIAFWRSEVGACNVGPARIENVPKPIHQYIRCHNVPTQKLQTEMAGNYAARIKVTAEERRLSRAGKLHALMSATTDFSQGGESFTYLVSTLLKGAKPASAKVQKYAH